MEDSEFKQKYLQRFPFDEILDTYMMIWLDYYSEGTGIESHMMKTLRPKHDVELKGKWLLAKKLAYEKFEGGIV